MMVMTTTTTDDHDHDNHDHDVPCTCTQSNRLEGTTLTHPTHHSTSMPLLLPPQVPALLELKGLNLCFLLQPLPFPVNSTRFFDLSWVGARASNNSHTPRSAVPPHWMRRWHLCHITNASMPYHKCIQAHGSTQRHVK